MTANEAPENLAWKMGKDLFGNYHSNRGDLSQNAKQMVKARIQAHHGKENSANGG